MRLRLLSGSFLCCAVWAGCLCLLMPPSAQALSTDSEEDIVIEADSARLDNLQGIAVYEGNVTVTQGSLRMTGNVMTVHFAEDSESGGSGQDKVEEVIMQGSPTVPATYRQLPDDSSVHDEAEAQRIEYHVTSNLVILLGDAQVRKEHVSFSGQRVEYDIVRSRVLAESDSEDGGGDGAANQDGRVRIVIPGKKESGGAESGSQGE